MTVEKLLASIKSGKSKRIKGLVVKRIDRDFEIEGDRLDAAGALARLESATTEVRSSGVNYEKTLFILITPYTNNIVERVRCKNKAGHTQMLAYAAQKKCHVYYGTVAKEYDRYICKQPWLLDWDSVPDQAYDKPPLPTKSKAYEVIGNENASGHVDGMDCPFCGKGIISAAGRTLHISTKHPERMDEYRKLLESGVPADEVELTADLSCPFCKKGMGTASGRTLHVKNKHPNRMDEYKKLLADA